jgi:hypothetical protein
VRFASREGRRVYDAAVRRGLVILVLAAVLGGCGGGDSGPDFAGARERTVADGSAAFSLVIDALVGGNPVRATETGTVSFTARRAHLYKLVPGGGLPQEIVLDGPYAYSNANVQAALQDRTVRPWTKLDTRLLTAAQRRSRPDELAHVRAVVHLADGVATARRVGVEEIEGDELTRFRGRVVRSRVLARAPAGQRAALAAALRNDYPARTFSADFWLDDEGRQRRVLVSYRTPGGTLITLDGRFSDFGAEVDLTVPPAEDIAVITP